MNSPALPEFLSAAQGYILALVLGYAVFTDCREHKIRNVPTLFALLAGLGISFVRGGWNGAAGSAAAPVSLSDGLMAAGVLFLAFFAAYLAGGLGAGDVKLASAVGALTGLEFSLWAALHTALAGGAVALFLMVWRGDVKSGMRRALGCLMHLRRQPEKDLPPAVPAAPAAEKTSEGSSLSASVSAPAGKPDRNIMPYAVAIFLGVAWTVWFYISRGKTLPIF